MATLSKSKTRSGATSWVVQFRIEGKRKTIRLPKTIKADDAAEDAALRIGELVDAKVDGEAVPPEAARWLKRQRRELREKLIKLELVEESIAATLGGFARAYIDSRKDVRPRTKINLEQARNYLIRHFGPDKPLAAISPGHADDFRRWLREQVGENTCRRHCGRAKQFFRAACRKRMLDANPFADMKQLAVGANRERDYFVTVEEANKVLEACPDGQWRLLFALSRFGGLRCPSEHLELTWNDIDWHRGRIIVRSPKTAHHEGKESRVVPLFPELRPYLQAEFHLAPDRSTYVITIPSLRHDRYANVRTRLSQIIEKAGLKPWPKLTHNLRASRETELAATFPQHVVCEWIGNSARVAAKHYLRVTDADYERAGALQTALQSAALGAAASSGFSCQEQTEQPDWQGASPTGSSSQREQYPRQGSKHPPDSLRKPVVATVSAAVALQIEGDPLIESDPLLADVVQAWPTLPSSVRKAVHTLVAHQLD
jgi:integrase